MFWKCNSLISFIHCWSHFSSYICHHMSLPRVHVSYQVSAFPLTSISQWLIPISYLFLYLTINSSLCFITVSASQIFAFMLPTIFSLSLFISHSDTLFLLRNEEGTEQQFRSVNTETKRKYQNGGLLWWEWAGCCCWMNFIMKQDCAIFIDSLEDNSIRLVWIQGVQCDGWIHVDIPKWFPQAS